MSSSALATATAISALAEYRQRSTSPIIARVRLDEMIDKGIRWCLARQNGDGGWGDTEVSHSNIATTMLVRSALKLANAPSDLAGTAAQRAIGFCEQQAAILPDRRGDSTAVYAAVRQRYGQDKTFAVPILANCAIAGLAPWSEVSALPCEAAMIPRSFFRFVRLPVVSYAIPALVSIGQAKFFCDPPANPLTRRVRRWSVNPGMRLLAQMQPASGGFLEAIPLTSFVAMSLAHSERADHEVTVRCIRFINDSFRDLGDEGTWPIDTNLATWNTTLAINAIGQHPADPAADDHLSDPLLDWLLSCQCLTIHPFTGAAPGGWGWSDLSGAVPDADDTPGALLALRHWWRRNPLTGHQRQRILQAAGRAARWLLDLQNRDRGWPTFCRGWGRLPFDRSGTDITAHVLRGLAAWHSDLDLPEIGRALGTGFEYLRQRQNPDGSWSPLWFGNQDHPREDNLVYGTTRVLMAWRDCGRWQDPAAARGIAWLLNRQNEDGGWGGGPSRPRACPGTLPSRTSSLQETSLACEVLAAGMADNPPNERLKAALDQGVAWLLEGIEREEQHETWPIGFYFAKLWYYEALYPPVFATSALRTLLQREFVTTGPTRQETRAENNRVH